MLLYLYCTMCTCVVLSKITSICCANTMQLFYIFYVVMQQILHILCYQYATILNISCCYATYLQCECVITMQLFNVLLCYATYPQWVCVIAMQLLLFIFCFIATYPKSVVLLLCNYSIYFMILCSISSLCLCLVVCIIRYRPSAPLGGN